MEHTAERRSEKRLRYYWPIWFAEDFSGALSQGKMVDLSSRAAAFTCQADEQCPYPGQWLTARFSVPQYGPEGAFGLADFMRSGCVQRVDDVGGAVRRVALQFAEPLPFRPGEQACE